MGKPKSDPKPRTPEWDRAEYETKTKSLLFTKDFQSRQEVLMRDPLASVGERVMAWIMRYSWGEFRLYAVKGEGLPAFQVDCARALKVDKRRVADAVGYLKTRGYLEVRGKLLYPVVSPVLARPQTKGEEDVKKSGVFRTFLDQWKVAHSSDFEQLEVARSTVKRITKVLLSDYKKSKKQVDSAAGTLLETKKSISETGQRAAVSPFEADNQRHQKTPAQDPVDEGVITRTEAADLVFSEIARMQKAHPNTPFAKPPINRDDPGDVGLVRRILTELGMHKGSRCDEQHLIGYFMHIAAQFKGWGLAGSRKPARDPAAPTGPKSIALLVNWAQDYARIAGRGEAS